MDPGPANSAVAIPRHGVHRRLSLRPHHLSSGATGGSRQSAPTPEADYRGGAFRVRRGLAATAAVQTPELLPIGEIDPAFAPAIPICRELPTDAGPIDLAYVSESGRLTLVECKLWKNPEARREVVAQILDYAKELNRWSNEDLSAAVRRARRAKGGGDTLFELVRTQSETVDETDFVDDVTRSLTDGRFLLLVVGDPVREGVERIAEHLRRFAGIQFTFGLVELAMFEMPAGHSPVGLVVEPRVLARTVEIERAIVRRADIGVAVEEPPMPPAGKRPKRRITEDAFYTAVGNLDPKLPDRLKEFFGGAENLGLGVTVGGASLILHWHREDGTRINFGTFFPDGNLNTKYIADSAEQAGDLQVGVDYLEAVSGLIPGAKVKKVGKSWTWKIVVRDRLPKFAVPLERSNEWIDAIQETMDAFNRLATD